MDADHTPFICGAAVLVSLIAAITVHDITITRAALEAGLVESYVEGRVLWVKPPLYPTAEARH